MIRFLLRRTIHATLVVFVVLSATFAIVDLAPGDPSLRYYDPEIDPAIMQTVRTQLGLDEPLPVRYIRSLSSYVRGNFGVSFRDHRNVSEVIGEAAGRTIVLTGTALLLQLVLGVTVGALAAARRNRTADRVASLLALVFFSVPSFYLAYTLIGLFALELRWLPPAGMQSIDLVGERGLVRLLDRVRHLVLPVAVLTLTSTAAMVRYTRGRFIDVLVEDHIRTARAKGLPDGRIMWTHVFRNALPQLLTLVGLSVPYLIAGAVVVEKIFAWPGMGALMVDAIYARDYPIVVAAATIAAVAVVAANFAVDVVHFWVDPRVRRAGEVG